MNLYRGYNLSSLDADFKKVDLSGFGYNQEIPKEKKYSEPCIKTSCFSKKVIKTNISKAKK